MNKNIGFLHACCLVYNRYLCCFIRNKQAYGPEFIIELWEHVSYIAPGKIQHYELKNVAFIAQELHYTVFVYYEVLLNKYRNKGHKGLSREKTGACLNVCLPLFCLFPGPITVAVLFAFKWALFVVSCFWRSMYSPCCQCAYKISFLSTIQ